MVTWLLQAGGIGQAVVASVLVNENDPCPYLLASMSVDFMSRMAKDGPFLKFHDDVYDGDRPQRLNAIICTSILINASQGLGSRITRPLGQMITK